MTKKNSQICCGFSKKKMFVIFPALIIGGFLLKINSHASTAAKFIYTHIHTVTK